MIRSPTNGMVSQIVGCWLLWEVSLARWSEALFCAFVVKRSINRLATRLGKPFYDKNFLISLSSAIHPCMGGSLGPVQTNIIMTEFEHEIINNLINQGLIAFYCRYVDDTLLLIKRNTITTILEHFHKFDRNIRFTFDLFENCALHFLDINIASDGLGIYRKDTLTGQYTNFHLTVSFLCFSFSHDYTVVQSHSI